MSAAPETKEATPPPREAANNPKRWNQTIVSNDRLQAPVSVFADAYAKEPSEKTTIADFLSDTASGGNHAALVTKIRSTEDKAKRDELKKRLAAITLSGRIEGKRANAMEEGRFHHSGVLQLDFDNIEEPEKFRDELVTDPHVIAAWLSPSGKGVKGLAAMEPVTSEENHKAVFLAAEKHFAARGWAIDKACKDPARLCFVSWDADLRISDKEAQVFHPIREERTAPTSSASSTADFPEPPEHGIHSWMMEAAWWCRNNGMDAQEAIAKIESYEGMLRRSLQPAEAKNAVEKVYSATLAPQIPDDVFPVPGGGIGNNAAAEIIFPALAKSRRIFMRGTIAHEVARSEKTDHLAPISAERFCSIIETGGSRIARRETTKDDQGKKRTVWRSTTFPMSAAKIQLETDAARMHLPPIRQLTNCPIITPDGILGKGYHDHAGGTYISTGSAPERIPKGTAFRSLLDILSDFNFATDSDRSRAFASLISPALKMGGWINDDFPLDFAEADQSQSGKTFRQKLVCRIYNEIPTSITIAKGGVGNIDESISAALVRGRPFITLGNIRGKIDSTILEEALRGSGRVNCRTLRHSAEVDCRPFLWQLSTNGAELTRDLANRAIVTRIRKQPSSYEWKQYPEGNIESHIIANQSFYLGCVFSIIEDWHLKGRPRTNESRHDFREWCRTLDAIVQMFTLAPLLDGHKEQQERTANPQLQWLREVVLAAKKTQHGCELYTHDLVNIAEDLGIEFPGNPHSRDEPTIRAGRVLGKIFRDADADEITVDSFTFTRTEAPDYSENGKGYITKKYTIRQK